MSCFTRSAVSSRVVVSLPTIASWMGTPKPPPRKPEMVFTVTLGTGDDPNLLAQLARNLHIGAGAQRLLVLHPEHEAVQQCLFGVEGHLNVGEARSPIACADEACPRRTHQRGDELHFGDAQRRLLDALHHRIGFT
jgi:hypothetical protein